MTKMEQLSAYRLNGEPVPRDLAALVPYADELERRLDFLIGFERDWAPWADYSYIKEPVSPDVRANIKAHEMVFRYVAFFAEHGSGEYLGYWRGPGMRSIAQSRYVLLDNEGQYTLYNPERTAAAIIAKRGSSAKSWLESLDVGVADERVIEGPGGGLTPCAFHEQWYKKLESSQD